MNRAGLSGLPSPKANEARPGGAQRALKGKVPGKDAIEQSPALRGCTKTLCQALASASIRARLQSCR